jgi:pimeloyl-ACP methyl ester carboxylesterase/DNA-binding winged helix-turn-helix (wHTH) protein
MGEKTAAGAANLIYRFEGHALDTGRRELRRGAHAIAVEPQVFDLLEYLICNRDRVVSKDDLLTAIWDGRLVSESALSTRINQARSAIGDSGEEQRLIRTLRRKGLRFVADVREESSDSGRGASVVSWPVPAHTKTAQARTRPQDVRFCRATDGVNLAIATNGEGLPVVKVGTWLGHVEHDWQSPVWSPLHACLASRFRLIRYDQRGCGLSERDVAEISFAAFVGDLETVVDSLGLQRFALYGISQGAAVSIAYAARYPERVSRLVLSGGRAVSWRKLGDPVDTAKHEALLTLIRHGWGQDNPAFRQVFTSRNWPDATIEEMKSLNELQQISTSPENAVRVRLAYSDFDLTELLPRVVAPTLVLHSRDDASVPFELGLKLARGIPNARLVALNSRSHTPLPAEPAWPRYVAEICAFLEEKDKGRLHLVAP